MNALGIAVTSIRRMLLTSSPSRVSLVTCSLQFLSAVAPLVLRSRTASLPSGCLQRRSRSMGAPRLLQRRSMCVPRLRQMRRMYAPRLWHRRSVSTSRLRQRRCVMWCRSGGQFPSACIGDQRCLGSMRRRESDGVAADGCVDGG